MTAASVGTRVGKAAKSLGCTDGQLYTVVFGLIFSVVFAFAGIPPVLQRHLVAAGRGAGTSASSATPQVLAGHGPLPPLGPPPLDVPTGPSGPLRPVVSVGGPNISTTSGSMASDASTQNAPQPVATTPAPPPLAAGTVGLFAHVVSPGAPDGVAVDRNGNVYVATNNGSAHGVDGPSKIFEYAPDGRLRATFRIRGQALSHVQGLTALAAEASGRLVVLDGDSGRILEVDMLRRAQTLLATLPDLPPCLVSLPGTACEPGAVDHRPQGTAVTISPSGAMYVADGGQATIWRLRRGYTIEPWYQSLDFVGPDSDGPAGLALAPDGRLDVTVGSTTDTSNPAGGGLYELSLTPAGDAGQRTLRVPFARGVMPGAIVMTRSGQTLLVLRGSDSLAVVPPGGNTATALGVANSAGVPIDGLAGLALVRRGLLATNMSRANEPSEWAVLSITLVP